jgi:hypothetical protein
VRSLAELERIIGAAYGPQTDVELQRVHRGLGRAAAWIEAGDLGHAGVEAVMLRLPELPAGVMAKLARLADFEKDGSSTWENEPRVPAGQSGGGRWTTGGASSSAPEPTPRGRSGGKEPQRSNPTGRDLAVPVTAGRGLTGLDAADLEPAVLGADDRGMLTTASTAAVLVGPSGVSLDLKALPPGALRLGRAGLLGLGAELLNQWDDAAVRQQITNAISRFELNDQRPADVIAASAYV